MSKGLSKSELEEEPHNYSYGSVGVSPYYGGYEYEMHMGELGVAMFEELIYEEVENFIKDASVI